MCLITPADYEFFNEGVSDHQALSGRGVSLDVRLRYEGKKELAELELMISRDVRLIKAVVAQMVDLTRR
ncbi:hypothetical protein Tco_0593051 [Tanacetum coccineum]